MRAVFQPRILFLLCSGLFLGLASNPVSQAQQVVGSIIGHVSVAHGGAPAQRLLVSLELHGATIDSVFTDSQGTFGFHGLAPNSYSIVFDDEHYERFQKELVIDATMMAPTVIAQIALIPKKLTQSAAKPTGANPAITDVREYAARFPKAAVKEFEKGLRSDSRANTDDAIRHYQKTLQLAPGFYEAHNNLGSDYLIKSDIRDAREEFERVVQLNQSDAAGYFNMSNVCMLSGQMADAQKYLDEGIRRQPDSALGAFLRGSLDLRLGKLPDAEQNLRRAIELSPIMVQAHLQLVNLLLRQGRKQDAVSQLRDFVQAFPDSPFNAQAKQLIRKLESQSTTGQIRPN